MGKSRLDDLRTWWVWRKDVVGLLLTALALVLLCLLFMPFSSPTKADGTVVEFRKLGRKGSVEIYAVVETAGRRSLVKLDLAHDCHVGSVISIQKRRTLTGVRYVAPRGCRPA